MVIIQSDLIESFLNFTDREERGETKKSEKKIVDS